MKLFDNFEAIRLSQENLIFITQRGFLYYIYSHGSKDWSKHRRAGNDYLTVANYDEVSKEELTEAMNGVFPKSETDFIRLCDPRELSPHDMVRLLEEDYTGYMSDQSVYHTVSLFLSRSDICHKSFEKIKELLSLATESKYDNTRVITQIKELSLKVIGRDVFKKEIRIVDGHDGSSYFWIMPARVIDYEDTRYIDSVAKMGSAEISIEEDDVYKYLTPFLYDHFDEELAANKKRGDVSGFEWYLEHNFFTLEQASRMLKDIADTVDALTHGRETEYTKRLKSRWGAEDDSELELIVDFYRRFLYRMEYMITVGGENGYDLISFMGP